MSPEERALELERMQKCLAFAADVFTVIGDAFITNENDPSIHMSEFGRHQFDPLLKKHNLLCAGYRQDRLLRELGDTYATFQLTTCGVWDFAHSCHHVIFDEDIKS